MTTEQQPAWRRVLTLMSELGLTPGGVPTGGSA